jgi:outer membrane cobalamin receptor
MGYLWQPPSTIDAPVAARILIPSLAGQTLATDVKAEKDWTAELGVSERLARVLTLGLTGWGRMAIDQLDRVNVGTTNLVASYNFERGRAAGVEASCMARVGNVLVAFANVGLQRAEGQSISSARYLFSPEEIADKKWVMLDHVQTWTANVGFDLHDQDLNNHFSGLVNYGSGMRTGADSDKTVPAHVTLDLTLRHRLDVPLQPEVAFDVFNVFNEVYAYRIATGYVGSAYGPLRRTNIRLIIPFGQ